MTEQVSPSNLTEEIAAAEAALKTAQEQLDAIKGRLAEEDKDSSDTKDEVSELQDEVPDTVEASGTGAVPEPSATSQTAPVSEDPPTADASHAGPGAVPPQQPYYGYPQGYYQQAYAQPVVATKDHVAAGLLAIFLGSLGIHKFYLGYNSAGFIMLAVTVLGSLLTFGLAGAVMSVIAIIEGILYLTKTQTEFEQIYVLNKREWF